MSSSRVLNCEQLLFLFAFESDAVPLADAVFSAATCRAAYTGTNHGLRCPNSNPASTTLAILCGIKAQIAGPATTPLVSPGPFTTDRGGCFALLCRQWRVCTVNAAPVLSRR